jgi:hypothetical protein
MVKLQCHEIKKEFNKSHCLTSCNQHLHHNSYVATQNFNNYEYFFTPTNVLLLLKIWKFQQSFELKYNTMCAYATTICVCHNSWTFRLFMKSNHPPRCFGLPPKNTYWICDGKTKGLGPFMIRVPKRNDPLFKSSKV